MGQSPVLPFSRLPIKTITTNEGLSGNVVLGSIQDKYGFIWIVTKQGLTRYDGSTCTIYLKDDSNDNSLSYNDLSDIAIDSEGDLWISTLGGGINRFNIKEHRFEQFLNDPENSESLMSNSIDILFVDSYDNVWAASPQHTGLNLKRKNENRFIHFYPRGNDENSIPSQRINSICEDKLGIVWIATAGGLCKYNNRANNFERIKLPNDVKDVSAIYAYDSARIMLSTPVGLMLMDVTNYKCEILDVLKRIGRSDYIANVIYVDPNKYVWLGSRYEGIIFLTPDFKFHIPITEDFKSENAIRKNDIRDIFRDNQGNVWLSTYGGGITRVNSDFRSFNLYNYNNSKEHQLTHNVILSFAQIDRDNIMLGTDGGGLFKFNKRDGSFKNYALDKYTNVVMSQCIDNHGTHWLGTYRGGLVKYLSGTNKYKQYWFDDGPDGNSNNCNTIYTIVQIGEQLWLGTNGGGVLVFDLKTEKFVEHYQEQTDLHSDLADNYVRTIYYDDASKLIWIGHFEGISIFNLKSSTFKHINITKYDSTYLGAIGVNHIYKDSRGLMWISTNGKGLFLIDELHDTVQFFDQKQGFSAFNVYSTMEDNYKNLWLSTNNGIIKCSIIDTTPYKLSYTVFQAESGLQDNDFMIGSYYKDDEGYFYYGGRNGFNVFTPWIFNRKEKLINGIFLIDFKVSGVNQIPNAPGSYLSGDINAIDYLELDYNAGNFSLGFSSPNFSGFGTVKYAYMLEPINSEWQYTDRRGMIYYDHLPAGKYILHVKASIDNVEWIDRKPLNISILPPWWKRVWVQLIFVFVVLFIAVSMVYFRFNILKRQKNILEQKVKERTVQLDQKNKILFDRNEEIKTQNEILEEQKAKIERAYDELSHYRSNLEVLVDQRTKELKAAKVKAEESDKLKSSFLSNLSHEIRTPLNAIIGYSSLISEPGNSSDDLKSFQSLININSNLLLNLISDIIDFSKIESNELFLNYSEVEINKLLNNIEETFRFQIREQNGYISTNAELVFIKNPQLDKLTVYTDEDRLLQVLSQVLSNAIKFTLTGSIEVSSELIQNGNVIQFKIKDTGIGISKSNQQKIFEKFVKIEDDKDYMFRGAGLGLSISKNLVEMMGGEIWVESELHKGSEFYITIPVKKDVHTAPLTKTRKKIVIPELSNVPVLIAEDDWSNFDYLNRILKRTGAIIHHAKNGKEVLEILERVPGIKIILMDIKMPVMGGIEAFHELRKKDFNIPVVAQTAYAFAEEVEKIKSEGFTDYLAKPLTREKIYTTLLKYITLT